jgi:hypothetical protein
MNILSTLSSEQMLYLVLGFHSLIGAAGTTIAWRKGRSLKLWMFLGLTCGTAAFVVSLLLKPLPEADEA